MVWIHGGQYQWGHANIYPAENLVAAANGSAIVVSIQYRLGALGFTGSDLLRNRSSDSSTGNYGIQDQRMALTWVQKYISFFGGDPAKVMIFGESAGAGSVMQHLVQKQSFGLYSKATMQSHFTEITTMPAAEAQFGTLLQFFNCSTVACLLAVPASDIMAWSNNCCTTTTYPVIDGVSLTADVNTLLTQGKFNKKVPILIGSNSDEYAIGLFPSFVPRDMDENTFLSFLVPQMSQYVITSAKKMNLLPNASQILQLYDPSVYAYYPSDLGVTVTGVKRSIYYWMLDRVTTEWPGTTLGLCSVRRHVNSMLQAGAEKVFVYEFDHGDIFGNTQMINQAYMDQAGMSMHMSELEFVFPNSSFLATPPSYPDEVSLATLMTTYWVNFAKSGNPNGPSVPKWPAFSSQGQNVQYISLPSNPVAKNIPSFKADVCNYWDSMYGMFWTSTPYTYTGKSLAQVEVAAAEAEAHSPAKEIVRELSQFYAKAGGASQDISPGFSLTIQGSMSTSAANSTVLCGAGSRSDSVCSVLAKGPLASVAGAAAASRGCLWSCIPNSGTSATLFYSLPVLVSNLASAHALGTAISDSINGVSTSSFGAALSHSLGATVVVDSIMPPSAATSLVMMPPSMFATASKQRAAAAGTM